MFQFALDIPQKSPKVFLGAGVGEVYSWLRLADFMLSAILLQLIGAPPLLRVLEGRELVEKTTLFTFAEAQFSSTSIGTGLSTSTYSCFFRISNSSEDIFYKNINKIK